MCVSDTTQKKLGLIWSWSHCWQNVTFNLKKTKIFSVTTDLHLPRSMTSIWRGSTKDLSLPTCCCGLRRGFRACLDCVSKDIDGRKAGTENWTVHVSFPMGLFQTCHKIMTVTMLASVAAFGLSESKGATPSLGRDGLHVPRIYVFRSTLEPCGTYCALRTAFLWLIYHLSLPSALQASKVGHSGETLDLPDSQIWSTAV